ncbi:MAG: NADPH-dependent FMN reductase [Alphaproteobacteria bacterium]
MTIEVLGLSGSLRRESLNTKLLHAAATLAPEDMRVATATLHDIPLYDGDVEAAGIPAPVTALAERIAAADAVLIVSPEYNYSMPGVLKNGLDWLSRVKGQPFAHKPLAIMGTSPGRFGTVRMQHHLRQALLWTAARVLTKPEVMLGGGGSVFDEAGKIRDESAANLVRRQLEALAAAVAERRRAAGA